MASGGRRAGAADRAGARPRVTSRTAAGRAAEERAVAYLRGRGYRVVERNFRCRIGELDIVARDGDALVFAEVRSRTSAAYGSALEAVTPAKQRQVAAVAAAYVALRRPRARLLRFDVVAITGDEVVLVKDAFRLGL